jgi:hypothetical protein
MDLIPRHEVTLYVVKLPYATFGLEARNGVIVRAAPFAGWTVGRKIVDVLGYYKRRFPESEWMTVADKGKEGQ